MLAWELDSMAEVTYRMFVKTAILLALIIVGWSIYNGVLQEKLPGENHYHAANKFFEDGEYSKALLSYQQVLLINPEFIHAKRGAARSLMQLGRLEESLNLFNEVIEQEPTFAASYANRGILYDRIEEYSHAINDYKAAIKLNSELIKGPSWLTRFLRNQTEKPPSIKDRMIYLQHELQKPKHERLLNIPDLDNQQEPYKS